MYTREKYDLPSTWHSSSCWCFVRWHHVSRSVGRFPPFHSPVNLRWREVLEHSNLRNWTFGDCRQSWTVERCSEPVLFIVNPDHGYSTWNRHRPTDSERMFCLLPQHVVVPARGSAPWEATRSHWSVSMTSAYWLRRSCYSPSLSLALSFCHISTKFLNMRGGETFSRKTWNWCFKDTLLMRTNQSRLNLLNDF